MNYQNDIKYVHLFIIAPLLIFIAYKGLNKQKVSNTTYAITGVLGVLAILLHTNVISLHGLYENFTNVFKTGQINRTPVKWDYEPQTHEVIIENYEFTPQFVSVMRGDTVRWINRDNDTHTVTSYTSMFDSGDVNSGEVYEQKFDALGVYNYYCKSHPYTKGSVTVVNAAQNHSTNDHHVNQSVYFR